MKTCISIISFTKENLEKVLKNHNVYRLLHFLDFKSIILGLFFLQIDFKKKEFSAQSIKSINNSSITNFMNIKL